MVYCFDFQDECGWGAGDDGLFDWSCRGRWFTSTRLCKKIRIHLQSGTRNGGSRLLRFKMTFELRTIHGARLLAAASTSADG